MAGKKLRIVMDWKGVPEEVTEEVTESLPGKGQTLDGKTEDKGKGISGFEEEDVSEWSSKKEGPLCSDDDADGNGPIHAFRSEGLASRGGFFVEATKLDKYDIERIIVFHGVFCKAYNDIVCYSQYYSKIVENRIEMIDGKGGAAEGNSSENSGWVIISSTNLAKNSGRRPIHSHFTGYDYPDTKDRGD
ncbi:hypothetical protein OCU04_003523 [Sclerotinia nivalis]|uniref:Uncharacterized protein n=1 Tax=Sclerotinia nivalis TaxID=352851 RepID=A0A9X0AS43_9HELO|nr:hypothetical protein OCU04_003523 [Sclerotinia nivalis]